MNSTNKKYSLYTVINSDYSPFGRIWINSAFDKLNMDNVEDIFLVDAGLNSEDRDYFSSFDKVIMIDSGISTDLKGGVHGKGWLNTVKTKTKTLMAVIDVYDTYPIVMSDLDCMFINDISHLIDEDYDLQACFRGWKDRNSPYLASFTVVNNSKGREFLGIWNSYIDGIRLPNKESPALTKAVRQHKDEFKIGNVSNGAVNGVKIRDIDKCDIIHFKSKGSYGHRSTLEKRIWGPINENGFSEYVKEYLR